MFGLVAPARTTDKYPIRPTPTMPLLLAVRVTSASLMSLTADQLVLAPISSDHSSVAVPPPKVPSRTNSTEEEEFSVLIGVDLVLEVRFSII